MRIPYAPTTPNPTNQEHTAIYDRIRARRHPRPLIPLDLALLHNPNIADGFNTLLGAIRTKSTLNPAAMELAVCYVAVLNRATYEWKAHAPLALKAGVSRETLATVLDSNGKAINGSESGALLTDEEIDVLDFTYQSTKNVEVDDAVMERLKARYSEQQVMELAITVAAYNMVSRFLVSLDVTESNGVGMMMPE